MENRAGYKIIRAEEGVIFTVSKYGRQVWSLARLRSRKDNKCAVCGKPLGDKAYMPMSNAGNRMERICQNHDPE